MSVFHDHEHGHDVDVTSQQWVGALSQSHPGLCGTPVGPGKDTHSTLGPVRERHVRTTRPNDKL